jgi:hypothetical protein
MIRLTAFFETMVCPPIFNDIIVYTGPYREHRSSTDRHQPKLERLGGRTHALDISPMPESSSLVSTFPAVSIVYQTPDNPRTVIIASPPPISLGRCSCRGGPEEWEDSAVSPAAGDPPGDDGIVRQSMAQ